ncbi:MAG: LD-carboxypeptidase [Solobacterium sp.]|nr:LD-carboxypeptidase [Solobacterium sp.]
MTWKKIALAGCSDPRKAEEQESLQELVRLLRGMDLEVVCGKCIWGGTAAEKAAELTSFFADPDMDYIFDITGGDLANEILGLLDYETIRNSRAIYAGYSDLTVVLNAILAKTGRETVNWQIRNLLYEHAEAEQAYFREKILAGKLNTDDLEIRLVRGTAMRGIVAGGNIRCLLKLAGTPYFPDMDGKILLLESMSGGPARMRTSLVQLQQMGVFEQVSGVLLGTFTQMDRDGLKPSVADMLAELLPPATPVAITKYIGHGKDARAAVIGRYMETAAGQP